MITCNFWQSQNVSVKVRSSACGHLRTWGVGDFLARKNYEMPERVRAEIWMQMQTLTILSSNETAIIGKIAQLKVFPLAFCTNNALTIRAFFSSIRPLICHLSHLEMGCNG